MTQNLPDPTDQLRDRLGRLDRQQIIAWQKMTPAERLAVAFQAYQFALDAVRVTERQRHPGLSEEEFNWRVTRRMQGDQSLGRGDKLLLAINPWVDASRPQSNCDER